MTTKTEWDSPEVVSMLVDDGSGIVLHTTPDVTIRATRKRWTADCARWGYAHAAHLSGNTAADAVLWCVEVKKAPQVRR